MRNVNSIRWTLAIAALPALVACGGNECKLDDPSSCPGVLVCEAVQGRETPGCFAPVLLQGKVFDLGTHAGVSGARVTALDVNGAAQGPVVISDENGGYSLRIPTTRSDEQGTPVARTVTLRASAKDYQTFPSGVRVALPIDTSAAASAKEGEPWVLSGGQTDIGLAQLEQADRGNPSISGTVELTEGQSGVLVVAEAAGQQGRTAVADASGDFVIFNVPPGTWSIRAFSKGANYTPGAATVEAGKDVKDVRLTRATTPTGTVSGSVNIVSATGATSVVLVVKSTFVPNLARGEVPPGLRAPEPGIAPNVDGTFSISGVPDGEYVVLAAFENDGLVRDPNTNTAGTELQYVTVANGTADRQPTFKVTNAMTLVSPGAGDSLDEVSATPALTFKPYPSAGTYDVLVFDTFGNEVWHATSLSLPTSGDLSVDYGGEPLTSGMVYQWRAVAYGKAGQPISQTEDLKGLFRVK